MDNSSFSNFQPHHIPYQLEVIKDIYLNYDYSKGIHEILLSGSVGSAKSTLMAHLACRHCIENNGARILLGRKSLPDLKSTIFQKITEHLDDGYFIEGVDYQINETSASIYFRNGSEIISRSWSDKKYKKIRSLELSAAIIEELTENDDEDKEAYDEIRMRVGRLPHVKQSWIMSATNPDSPAHWAYKYFITSDIDTRHVYYSVTKDNPFLPKSYYEQLKKDLDPKLARRMLYGEWLEIANEVVYYSYDRSRNYREEKYKIDKNYPIDLSWDFNIGEGKPLSVCVSQFKNDQLHVFGEVVVDGMNTEDSLHELESKGYLDHGVRYLIFGDATGKHRDTRSKRSDYDIIVKYLSNHKNKDGQAINFEMCVPPSNPPVRKRHNAVNAYCLNENNDVRLFVYADAPTVDEGLRLVQLKKGGQYTEDDSMRYQHITTALGYDLCQQIVRNTKGRQSTRIL